MTYWIFKSLRQFEMPLQKKSENLSYSPRRYKKKKDKTKKKISQRIPCYAVAKVLECCLKLCELELQLSDGVYFGTNTFEKLV